MRVRRGSLPVGIDQYRAEAVTQFNATFPVIPPSTPVSAFCTITEQGSPIVRCDASVLLFPISYPYDTLPILQALAGFSPTTLTLVTENPPNP